MTIFLGNLKVKISVLKQVEFIQYKIAFDLCENYYQILLAQIGDFCLNKNVTFE